jgi:hypothetical protein
MCLLCNSYTYFQAKKIIIENQEYTNITQELERDFNNWDLDRMIKLNFVLGSFVFAFAILYLLLSITINKTEKERNELVSSQKKNTRKKNNEK